MSRKKVAIVISGMHRSGTSSIANVVHLLGASLPAHLMPAKPDNPHGFFESEKIMMLNDRIFSEAGSSWSSWQSLTDGASGLPVIGKYLNDATAVLADEFGGSDLVVIKDPRFSKILPLWHLALENLGFRVGHIIPVRNPEEVAASLNLRNGIPKSIAQLAWARHYLDAELHSRGHSRVFILWDDFMMDWEREMSRTASLLEISWPNLNPVVRAEIGHFLSPDLRHHRAPNMPDGEMGNSYSGEIYAALPLFRKDPRSVVAGGKFDAIRSEFLRTEKIYSPAFADMEAKLVRLELERDAVAGELARTKIHIPALMQERNLALTTGSALSTELVHTRSRAQAAIQAHEAALTQAGIDREAWSAELQAKASLADDLEQRLAVAQRRFRMVKVRMGEFRKMNGFRRMVHSVFGGDRFFNPEAISSEPLDEEMRYDGPIEELVPPAATFGLRGLLGLNGVPFLVGAYGRLLGRLPDESGLAFYLPRLLRGVPKLEILGEIASSREAQGLQSPLPGLAAALRRHAWAQVPILGLAIRLFFVVEGNSPTERRLRAMEQALFIRNHRAGP